MINFRKGKFIPIKIGLCNKMKLFFGGGGGLSYKDVKTFKSSQMVESVKRMLGKINQKIERVSFEMSPCAICNWKMPG